MSTAVLRTASGPAEILSGRLTMPLLGNWTAHLELGESAVPAGAVTIELAVEGGAPVVWSGYVDHGDTWQGRQKLVVMGGAGGLTGKVLDPKAYLAGKVPVPAAQVVTDALVAAGEQLADFAQAALAGLGFARWDRPGGAPASRALGHLAKRLGMGWRVLDSGRVWIGPETWPAVNDQLVSFIEDRDGDLLADRCAPDAAVLRPGTAILGRQIQRVTFTITGDGAPRAELLYRSDRSDLAAAVRAVYVPDPLALLYEAKVDSQNADGTLDLIVDEPLLPELRGVRYRGTNGGAETFAGGESVLLAFLGGREDGAIAWGAERDAAATHPLALVGDSCGYISGTVAAAPGPVTFALSPIATGAPGEVQVTVAGPGHKRARGESA